jgi:hypothetical protein
MYHVNKEMVLIPNISAAEQIKSGLGTAEIRRFETRKKPAEAGYFL